MTLTLHLYGRRDCHLCAEMRDALDAQPWPLSLREFDVDSDERWQREYGPRVPVLTLADGTEICHYFLDTAALRRHLDMQ